MQKIRTMSMCVFLAGTVAWLGAAEDLRPAGYAGTPFGDARGAAAPQSIPGRVRCARYDVGGEGVA